MNEDEKKIPLDNAYITTVGLRKKCPEAQQLMNLVNVYLEAKEKWKHNTTHIHPDLEKKKNCWKNFCHAQRALQRACNLLYHEEVLRFIKKHERLVDPKPNDPTVGDIRIYHSSFLDDYDPTNFFVIASSENKAKMKLIHAIINKRGAITKVGDYCRDFDNFFNMKVTRNKLPVPLPHILGSIIDDDILWKVPLCYAIVVGRLEPADEHVIMTSCPK